MFPRNLSPRLTRLSTQFPALSIIGPRQSGKTTLARACFPEHHYVSLEDPDQREYAAEDPRGFLRHCLSAGVAGGTPDQPNRGVILDEVQKLPDLFSYLQGEIDRDRVPGRWILTGSQNFLLMSAISQSLAGRTAVCTLPPLSCSERYAESGKTQAHWSEQIWRGFYPELNYRPELDPSEWYAAYLQTYVQRDVRDFARIGDLNTFSRFIRLCAGRSGQLLSKSALAVETGVSQPTISAWLSILEASGLVLLLPPYHRNYNKRLVKTPKLYWLDSGLLCYLLRIGSAAALLEHPFRGAVFESFVLGEIFKEQVAHRTEADIYFWRDRSGHEVDLILERDGVPMAIEIKATETVRKELFKGLNTWKKIAHEESTTESALVYAGNESFDRSGFRVVGWQAIASLVRSA